MADDNKIILVVDLDKKSVKTATDELKQTLEKSNVGKEVGTNFANGVGDAITQSAPNIGKLFSRGGAVFGAVMVGVAALAASIGLAIKKAFEETLKGEEINAINRQFDILAEQVGQNSEQLRQGFLSAADGLVDLEDVLKSSSKFIVEFGDDASRLPEVFDLARKATALFGGEVTQNFEQISQALATGQTRALRQFGIVVDQTEAYREFAKSIGIASSELNEAGRRQAIFEAALRRGSEVFDKVDPNIKQATTALQRFKVAFDELGDSIALRAESVFAPFFKSVLDFAAQVATKLGKSFEPAKSGVDSIAQSIETANARIKELKQELSGPIRTGNLISDQLNQDALRASREAEISQLQTFVNKQEEILMKSEARKTGLKEQARVQNRAADFIDLEARLANQLRLSELELSTQQQLLSAREQFNALAGVQEENESLKIQQIREQTNLRLLQLDQQFKSQELRSTEEFINARNNIIATGELQAQAIRERSLLQYQQTVNTVVKQGIVQLFSQGTQAIVGALARGENAFEAFGKAVLGIIGDMAIQIGTTLVAIGFSIDALKVALLTLSGGTAIAAGIALIAVGSLLKSLSGGAGLAGSAGGGGIASGGGAGGNIPPAQEIPTNLDERRGAVVNVNIDGSVFDSKETGLRISEIIRESFESEGARVSVA